MTPVDFKANDVCCGGLSATLQNMTFGNMGGKSSFAENMFHCLAFNKPDIEIHHYWWTRPISYCQGSSLKRVTIIKSLTYPPAIIELYHNINSQTSNFECIDQWAFACVIEAGNFDWFTASGQPWGSIATAVLPRWSAV